MLSRLSALSLKVDFDMSNTSYYDYIISDDDWNRNVTLGPACYTPISSSFMNIRYHDDVFIYLCYCFATEF